MSATIVSDSIVMTTADSQAVTAKMAAAMEVEFAKCDCCGLTEECTLEYIERIRERYQGKWLCGLCAEAVKDEIFRCERLISADEALSRHLNFCNKFRSSGPPPDPTVHLIPIILARKLKMCCKVQATEARSTFRKTMVEEVFSSKIRVLTQLYMWKLEFLVAPASLQDKEATIPR